VRDLGLFNSDEHRLLIYGARRCHYLHAYARKLETRLLEHVLGGRSGPLPKGAEAKRLLARFLPPEEMPAGMAPPIMERFDVPFNPAKPTAPAISHHPAHVFDHSGVYHLKMARLSVRDRHLAPALNELPDCLPPYVWSSSHKQRYSVNRDHLAWILEHGFDRHLIELVELTDLRDSVRLITVPSQPAFAVRAKKALPAGQITHTVRSDSTAS
jgi:hypothetical protein